MQSVAARIVSPSTGETVITLVELMTDGAVEIVKMKSRSVFDQAEENFFRGRVEVEEHAHARTPASEKAFESLFSRMRAATVELKKTHRQGVVVACRDAEKKINAYIPDAVRDFVAEFLNG